MDDCNQSVQVLLCNLVMIIINHLDAANYEMRPFRGVISAICQRN